MTTLKELRAIGAKRTPGKWLPIIAIIPHPMGDFYATTPWVNDHKKAADDLRFIATASTAWEKLLRCAEVLESIAPSWLPEGIRADRREALTALESE